MEGVWEVAIMISFLDVSMVPLCRGGAGGQRLALEQPCPVLGFSLRICWKHSEGCVFFARVIRGCFSQVPH